MQESPAPTRNLIPLLAIARLCSPLLALGLIRFKKMDYQINRSGKVEFAQSEITALYKFGTNYLLKHSYNRQRLQATFDAQSLSLFALAHAIDTFRPEKAKQKSYTFKSHYVFKLRRYADRVPNRSAISIQLDPIAFDNYHQSIHPQAIQDLEIETMRKLDINAALNSLPQSARRIVINYHYYGHDLRAISIMMQIPYSSLRIQYRAAMARLRYLLSCYEFD